MSVVLFIVYIPVEEEEEEESKSETGTPEDKRASDDSGFGATTGNGRKSCSSGPGSLLDQEFGSEHLW